MRSYTHLNENNKQSTPAIVAILLKTYPWLLTCNNFFFGTLKCKSRISLTRCTRKEYRSTKLRIFSQTDWNVNLIHGICEIVRFKSEANRIMHNTDARESSAELITQSIEQM